MILSTNIISSLLVVMAEDHEDHEEEAGELVPDFYILERLLATFMVSIVANPIYYKDFNGETYHYADLVSLVNEITQDPESVNYNYISDATLFGQGVRAYKKTLRTVG